MIFSSSTERLKHKQLCVIVHKENHINKPSQWKEHDSQTENRERKGIVGRIIYKKLE